MKKIIFTLASYLLLMPFINAQFKYSAATASSSVQTYNDLLSLGTVITTNFEGNPINYYQDNSSIQDIGFSFTFNGVDYTQLVLTTNGFIKFGTSAPKKGLTSPFNSETNILYPIGLASQGISFGAEYRVYTSGNAGSRICTIQFKGLADSASNIGYAKQFNFLEFQVKLYESSNRIEFVYGNFVPTGNSGPNYVYGIGIKGSDLLSFVNSTGFSSDWTGDSFVDTFSSSASSKYMKSTYYPKNGLTYTFDTSYIAANDAKVQIVYSLSMIVANDPHQLKAMIKNNGTNAITNLPVTLSVSGANSFNDVQYISSLPAGSTSIVNFTSYTPVNVGSDTISVLVPADDVLENNEIWKTETITSGTLSNASSLTANYGAINYGNGADVAILMENTGAKTIDSIKTYTTNSRYVGKKFLVGLYTYTANGPGITLWKSDTLLGELYHNYIAVPGVKVNGRFFVVISQPASTGYYISYEREYPLRDSIFYVRSPLNKGKWILQRGLTTNTNQNKFLADVHYAEALPIKLLDFTVSQYAKNASLQFITGNEETLSTIEIERSLDGIKWYRVVSLKAKGSGTTNNYKYTDALSGASKWYYRLKMIEKDGAITYSKMLMVELTNGSNFVLYNYPNPVQSSTTIHYELVDNAIVSLELYSIVGKLIKTILIGKRFAGANKYDLNIANLSMQNVEYLYKLAIKSITSGITTTLSNKMSIVR